MKGDATSPVGEGKKVIAHISNDIGAWGAGFVMALSNKWSEPEDYYRTEAKKVIPNGTLTLGDVQFVPVTGDITVANMIAQHGIRPSKDTLGIVTPPIRYHALNECLIKVNQYCIDNNCTLHAPRFGAGLAGGSWSLIETIINSTMSVDVTIYDFN